MNAEQTAEVLALLAPHAPWVVGHKRDGQTVTETWDGEIAACARMYELSDEGFESWCWPEETISAATGGT